METSEPLLSLLFPIVTTLAINASFFAHFSSITMFGRVELTDSLVAPHSLVIISCLNDLRNMKGHPSSDVTFGIPFLSHLWRCDGAARFVATCHVLIGWTWARSLIRHLVFPCLDFWGSL